METVWARELRRRGLRVTRPRLSVLSVLAERPHADADAIVTAAREGTDLLGGSGEVPSAEEIGAEFERFLADQDRKRPRD